MLMHICVSRRRYQVYPSGRKESFRGIDMFEKRADGEVSSTQCLPQRARSFCPEHLDDTRIQCGPEITARTDGYGLHDELRTEGLLTQHAGCSQRTRSPFISVGGTASVAGPGVRGPQ